MTFVTLVLIVLLLIAFGLLRLVRHHTGPVARLEDLSSQTRAVDLESLHNLIDSGETDFLRRSLSPAHFRMVQRQRALAAIEYVRNISHNAGLLISLGQLAVAHPDPQLAQAAQAMVDRALHVRTLATFAILKLYTRSIMPALPFEPENIFRDYRILTESAVLFTRLQRPALAGRVSTML
jgi:hypothetical protein